MTIKPGETRFSIDNLCIRPGQKTPKERAKGLTVVSWSYDCKLFTVVDVSTDYKKTILSYHDKIDDAIEASRKPVVSFI
jgi:hypothetical protein